VRAFVWRSAGPWYSGGSIAELARWLLCGHYYSLGTVTLGEAWVSMLELAAGACDVLSACAGACPSGVK